MAAIAFGCSNVRVSSIQIRTANGIQEILGFPDVPVHDAYQVDGTQQYSSLDQNNRFDHGPAWKNNSCALDSVLLVLLMLDMGRCQADQVWEGLLREQTPNQLSLTAMFIIRKPWSILTRGEITSLRNILRQGLYTYNPREYPLGAFHSATSIFDILTPCFPQVLATWAVVARCCPAGAWLWKTRSDGSIKLLRLNGLYVPLEMCPSLADATTFEQQVQLLLSPGPDNSPVANALPRCEACKHLAPASASQQQKVILDRPPFTLTFRDFSLKGGKEGMYESIDLTFVTPSEAGKFRQIRTRYACWGCIFRVHQDHFVVVVNRAARSAGFNLVFYDGMAQGGKLQPVTETFQDFASRKSYELSVLIYVRIA